jgi:hypothetical protein
MLMRPREAVAGSEPSASKRPVEIYLEVADVDERTFQALASRDVVDWWVRPGVFNTIGGSRARVVIVNPTS